jgi:hypothetical protein
MLERLPIDLIVEIGILAGPDEYEELAKTSKRNAIILQKPYIVRAMSELIVKVTYTYRVEMIFQGKSHSFNDQPATIWSDGVQEWYKHGEYHRDNDQPAYIDPPDYIGSSGLKEWYQHGKLHRDNDQPAVITSNNSKQWYQQWYQHGKLHRDNDQPAYIQSSGTKQWYQHGKLHRDNDQPAYIGSHGTKEWYQYGKQIK